MTKIGVSAFDECTSLATVIIGKEVREIGKRSFAECPELTDVYCYAENIPTSYDNTFMDSYIEYATLHVIAESMENYKHTVPWSSFGKIVVLTDEDPKPTGIMRVKNSMISDQNYFDLYGRKIIPNRKGVYIHDSKKVIIR